MLLSSLTPTMRPLAFLPCLAAWVTGTLGGQIPIVDGVLGGVPSGTSASFKPKFLSSQATTPGKLRVTENSGVCGMLRNSG